MSSPGVNLPALAFSHSDQICLAVSAVNFLSSISHPRDCADCPVHPAEHRCRTDECEEQGCTQDDVVFHVCLLLIDQLALGGSHAACTSLYLAVDVEPIPLVRSFVR